MENQQLSQILQQSLSPVHAAVQIPQPAPMGHMQPPPSFMYGSPNVQFMGTGPQAPSPYYNQQYNMGAAVVNHAQRFGARMSMMQDIRQQTPTQWGADQGMQMAVDPMTKRMAAAEEVAIRDSTSTSGFQGVPLVGGFQSAFNTASTIAGFIPGVGLPASIAMGIAGNMIGGGMDRLAFGGARDLRQGGMMLRSSLNVANLGNSFGMDQSGIMRHDVAQGITNQVSRLSQEDSRFSGKQFVQMTDKMANLGMLQGAGSTDEVVNRVKQVSKQLKLFMKIANEPDVMEALKQMGELRNMGVADANLNQAASNARAFARMAGMTRGQMHHAGQATGQMYEQQGLSGAAGYQMGMLTTGLAGQNLGMFSRGLQNRMGGAQGIGQAMARGVAGAQRHTTMDMLMHSVFQSKGGGQFGLDTNALSRIMKGGDLTQLFADKTQQLNASGNMMQHIQDMNERKPELREALQQRLGSSGMVLLTLRQAQAMQKVSGGNMTLNTALMRVTGGDADAARSIARIGTSPEATQRLMENMRHEQRRNALAKQDEIQHNASLGSRFGRWFRKTTDFGFSRGVAGFNARRAQEIRDTSMGVYGRDADADRLLQMNEGQQDAVKRMILSGGAGGVGHGADAIDENTGLPSWSVSPWQRLTGDGLQSKIAHEFAGYDGFTGRFRRSISSNMRKRMKAGGVSAVVGAVLNVATIGLYSGIGFSGTDLDTHSNKELVRRAMKAGKISRGALAGGDPSSLSEAAERVTTAGDAFFKGTGISSAGRSAVFAAGAKEIAATFNRRKGTFKDAKFGSESTEQVLIEQLKKQGLSDADARKKAQSAEGQKWIMAGVRGHLATRSSGDYLRERAMLTEQSKISGQTFSQRQASAFSAITEASMTEVGSGMGSVKVGLDKEEASQLIGIIGEAGAAKEGEVKSGVEIARLLSLKERGKLKNEDFQREIDKLYEGKTDAEKKKIKSMLGIMEKKFGSLGQKGDISGVLAEKKFDTGKFAKAVHKNLTAIQAGATQKKMGQRLSEDFGIDVASGENVMDSLLKKAEDSELIKRLRKKGGDSDKLATLLQDAREGKEGAKGSLYDFVKGKDRLSTGITATGGTTDSVAKRQMQMVQGLHDFATQNARNTTSFGTTVDRMSALIGKSDSGASLGSVVSDFKNAVDKFAATRMISKNS